MITEPFVPVVGVLLAGGRGRRMGGGDKPLNELGGKTLLHHAIDRAKPQVSRLILNANGDESRFNKYGLPVQADSIAGYAGPLAGVLTGMEWVERNCPEVEWIASFATDAPFFPSDMVSKLLQRQAEVGADIICAESAGRTHPVFSIWPVRLSKALRIAMLEEGVRKIDKWTAQYNTLTVDFAFNEFVVDPFFNINRKEDLSKAESVLESVPTPKSI